MANTWFRFKQFTIEQDRCAMKVGTDGVILGAWANAAFAQTALDIGTGTGLLSLMLAQKNNSLKIDALEIDPEAAAQATENVKRSIFRERIQVIHITFQDFIRDRSLSTYDLVVCNPPYFTTSKKGNNTVRNLARHDDLLSLELLLKEVPGILSKNGRFVLIIPAQRLESLIEQLHSSGLFVNRILEVYPVPGKPPVRFCVELSFGQGEMEREELVIETGKRHNYSQEYQNLTNPFYL